MGERSEQVKYFSTREEKFRISKRPCNILFIMIMMVVLMMVIKMKMTNRGYYVAVRRYEFSLRVSKHTGISWVSAVNK